MNTMNNPDMACHKASGGIQRAAVLTQKMNFVEYYKVNYAYRDGYWWGI